MSVSVKNVLSIGARIYDGQKETVYDVSFDSSYQAGGEPLPISSVGLNIGWHAICNVKATGSDTVNVASAFYDPATELIHLFDETPAEVASEANVEGIVVQVTTVGH